jgi:NTP pyrophosphatase (non-canonical NTP hydrolase)
VAEHPAWEDLITFENLTAGLKELDAQLNDLRSELGDELAEQVLRHVGLPHKRGQWHHVVSKRILDELDRHPILRDVFRRNDLGVRGLAEASHRGWKGWHEAYCNEVADWLLSHQKAMRKEFLEYLIEVYSRDEMKERFPGALIMLRKALKKG